MGDRVAQARPPELEAKMKKMKEKREREEKARLEEQTKSKKRSKGGDFLETVGTRSGCRRRGGGCFFPLLPFFRLPQIRKHVLSRGATCAPASSAMFCAWLLAFLT
jgi:hypothetical protein